MDLSDQQKNIINAPISPLSVIACAGSGKTRTAVNRLVKVRSDLHKHRGYVALLSFSNVAIKTFKDDYSNYMRQSSNLNNGYNDRVVIETLDSFLTSNILRPHASRSMNTQKTPFLITGSEQFLNNKQYKFWAEPSNGNPFQVQPKDIGNITVRVTDKVSSFWLNSFSTLQPLNNGYTVMERLGKLGAYTHELGKFWACKTLLDQKSILKAFVQRYPHIIVDEAQDIDALHSFLLEILIEAGVTVTLIGDPSQAIYEFAGANGRFLKDFDLEDLNSSLPLSVNYRSVEDILKISNKLSKKNDKHDRKTAHNDFGAYYCVYDKAKTSELTDSFACKVESLGLNHSDSAILFRGRASIKKLSNTPSEIGQGKTKLLALATIERDINKDYYAAFKLLVESVLGLLQNVPDDLRGQLVGNKIDPVFRNLRRRLWLFLRSSDNGLPSSTLSAKNEWHKLLKKRVISLLNSIEADYGYQPVDRIGNKIAATKLPITSLVPHVEKKLIRDNKIRIDTVHQSKGESLSAVLYVATVGDHIRKMLDGTETELGRIGYVALTRAKDIFVLAVPKNHINEFQPELLQLGLKEWII
jgi:superfamily I DNA/RNA helicase